MPLFPNLTPKNRPETVNAHDIRLDVRLGDCLEVMQSIPDGSADMVLCDLPYGTTRCAWDVLIPFEPLWKQYNRLVAPGGAVVLFATQPFTSLLVGSNLEQFKYVWVWDKVTGKGHLVAKKRPLQQTEDIAVFGRGLLRYYPIKTPRGKKTRVREKGRRSEIMGGGVCDFETTSNFRYPKTLLRFPWSPNLGDHSCLHPTQKPVALLSYLIRTYTLEGETVLDNCMGSGSTGVACARTGRHFIGIEKDPDIFRTACNRLGIKCNP